jgi:hypothetical protein
MARTASVAVVSFAVALIAMALLTLSWVDVGEVGAPRTHATFHELFQGAHDYNTQAAAGEIPPNDPYAPKELPPRWQRLLFGQSEWFYWLFLLVWVGFALTAAAASPQHLPGAWVTAILLSLIGIAWVLLDAHVTHVNAFITDELGTRRVGDVGIGMWVAVGAFMLCIVGLVLHLVLPEEQRPPWQRLEAEH